MYKVSSSPIGGADAIAGGVYELRRTRFLRERTAARSSSSTNKRLRKENLGRKTPYLGRIEGKLNSGKVRKKSGLTELWTGSSRPAL